MRATHDAAGYMTEMTMTRSGSCAPAGACAAQRYRYEWDEVGRLTRARRWDQSDVAQPADAELLYQYDSSDQRVRKTIVDGSDARHTVYVFASLELRLAEYDGTQYEVTDDTEVPYLFGHGVRLARVTYTDAAAYQTERRRIFLELGDHLGSTSVVLDHETGQLVERSTAYAYGSAENNYRPSAWASFREDYRFTGKEDDIEVGLIYFGARYLNPQLGRWISADPLAVHAPGKADLNLYGYVHGKVLVAVDPTGLEPVIVVSGQVETENSGGAPGSANRLASHLGAVQMRAGALTAGVAGTHHKNFGLWEQAAWIYMVSGNQIRRVHSLGHGQGGLESQPFGPGYESWRMAGAEFGRRFNAVANRADFAFVFHGCMMGRNLYNGPGNGSARDPGIGVYALLKEMPYASVYGHWNASAPGQPHDWHKVTFNPDPKVRLNIVHNVSPIDERIFGDTREANVKYITDWAIGAKRTIASTTMSCTPGTRGCANQGESVLGYTLRMAKVAPSGSSEKGANMTQDVQNILHDVQSDSSYAGPSEKK